MNRRTVNLKTIAEELGLSVPTVSLAISGHSRVGKRTRERVQKYCLKTNYLTLEQLESKRCAVESRRYGFMTAGYDLVSNDNMTMLNRLIEIGSAENVRFEVSSIASTQDLGQLENGLRNFCRDLDGLLLIDLVDWNILGTLTKIGVPHVVLGNIAKDYNCLNRYSETTVVGYNYIDIIRMITSRLIDCGHQRIGFVSPEPVKGFFFDNWHSGYVLGLTDNGIRYDPEYVFQNVDSKKEIDEVAGKLTGSNKPLPTAYIFPNSTSAAMFAGEMRQRNAGIDEEFIVISTFPEEAKRLGIESCVMVDTHSVYSRLAEISFSTLNLLVRKMKEPGEHLSIYPVCHNLP